MRLGCRSGVPLAYMNLLSLGSGVAAAEATGGEKGAAAVGTEVGGLGFAGRLSRLA